jgi:hypothetical protein
MVELEAQAEARRIELAALEEAVDLNAVDISEVSYSSSRATAKERAIEMMDYEWTVLANHKVTSSSDVIVPAYVKNATAGTTVTGIPYCWGGYNGYSTDGSYSSFESVVTSTAYTAGNTKSVTDSHVWGTIGLDCSGFVCSAYAFSSGTKYSTTSLASFGCSVSQNELKPMDFLVKSRWHVVLYAGYEDGSVKKYEAVVSDVVSDTEALDGKTKRNECNVTAMVSEGYVCRSPYHATCNQSEVEITSTTHARTCSICGHVWPSYSHNQNGEIIQGTTIHTYTCSVCDYGWKTEGHNRDTINYVPGESQHTCTCSVCEKTWNETHTFVKGLCSVCGMREVIIASID